MDVQFFDRQDEKNPHNGSTISQRYQLLEVVSQLQDRAPFFCELIGKNGYKILLGIGGVTGCVQYSKDDGNPPYLMAASRHQERSEKYVEFLTGGTLSPIPSRYCLPIDTVKDIAAFFQMTGERSPIVSWEEV